jgi:hypothetical protein
VGDVQGRGGKDARHDGGKGTGRVAHGIVLGKGTPMVATRDDCSVMGK